MAIVVANLGVHTVYSECYKALYPPSTPPSLRSRVKMHFGAPHWLRRLPRLRLRFWLRRWHWAQLSMRPGKGQICKLVSCFFFYLLTNLSPCPKGATPDRVKYWQMAEAAGGGGNRAQQRQKRCNTWTQFQSTCGVPRFDRAWVAIYRLPLRLLSSWAGNDMTWRERGESLGVSIELRTNQISIIEYWLTRDWRLISRL